MNDRGFLLSIRDQPDDDVLRLIYADWLDDRDQPERAEFIRLQVERAGKTPCGHSERAPGCVWCSGQMREEELLTEHGPRWLATLLPGTGWRPRLSPVWIPREKRPSGEQLAAFRRGLVEVIFLPLGDFLQNAGDLFACRQPIRRAQLTDRHPQRVRENTYGWSTEHELSGETSLPSILYEYLRWHPQHWYWPSDEARSPSAWPRRSPGYKN
jgi:uncharacterized protein (TIGR02996 family)